MAQKPIELGIDGGFQFELNDPKTTSFHLPTGLFRVGFFASEKLSVEPSVAFNWVKVSGDDAATTLQARLGVLYHFGADAGRSRVFLEPIAGITYLNFGGGSASQFQVGGGVGLKLPSPNRIGVRLEALFAHGFENDDFSSTDVIALLIGISFYTR
jgi:hypothetical protein